MAPWGGSPGFRQWWGLKSLLSKRQAHQAALEAEVEFLDQESQKLESSPEIQEREIRKNMGYAGKDEIVFDF
ncbi:MAG: septum formation initiator family protein [Bdellovibrionales bacterium]|nr:septum formation initiator family protein [Bdellovibrionales bacterium]